MSYFLVLSQAHGDGVLSRYQRLRLEGRMCDVVLEAGGVRFPSHRTLLACSSDYFWSLFQEHNLESGARALSLPALSAAGLEQVLDFIYTSWLPLCPSTLEDTLEAACYLQVGRAVELCSRYVSDSLALDNCCFFANVAARYGLGNALAAANRYLARHMGRLLGEGGDREGLLQLNLDSLQAALGADEVPGVREAALLRLALDWLARNPLPALHSNLLLSRLRLGLVPAEELARLSATEPALRTPFLHSLVQKARQYHGGGPRQPLLQGQHTSLRVAASLVILVGGGPAADRPQRLVQSFDPCTRQLRPLPAPLPLRLQHHSVCAVGNFLFVLGGEVVEADGEGEKAAVASVTGRVWRYDPRFECWEEAEPLIQERAQFCCCVAWGVIYAAGGRGRRGEPALSTVERYDMKAGCWRSARPLPHGVHGLACAALGPGLYVSGGACGEAREASKEVLFLDTRAGGGAWEKRAAMSIARFGHQMAALGERLYTFLGMYEPFCDIECYEPERDQWTRLRPLLSDRFCYGLATAGDGRALLFGGRKWQDGQEVSTPNVLEYDGGSDSWREVCKLPGPLCGTQCALLSVLQPSET